MLEIALQKLIENGCSMLAEWGTYGNICSMSLESRQLNNAPRHMKNCH